MRKILYLIYAIFLYSKLLASPIDPTTAKTIGENFLNERYSLLKSSNQNPIELELLTLKKLKSKPDLFYVFILKNSSGFIIISADDRAFPVLGYSFESSFDQTGENVPDAFIEWMESAEKQLQYIKDNNLKADSKTNEAWSYYRTKSSHQLKSTNDVAPMLTTTWNQGKYYNTLCPLGSGGDNGHVWVGCVAVCMAQVMKYWSYPNYGSGQNSYVASSYGTQTANFASTNYNWGSMPNGLSAENSAVATLMYHCGVSVNMYYAPGGSSSDMYTAAKALKTNFDYSQQIQLLSKSSYNDAAWDSLIRNEMDLGQPISMAGGTHAFNIDGYQGTNHFHLNWGWGGSYNGYFYLSALNPGSSNFTSSQQAIVHIRPNCGQAPTALNTLTSYSGTITDNGGSALNYMNCSDSKTLISPSGITKIKLLVSDFKTVAGQDTLYIYDGANETAPLLYALSGEVSPFEILSSGNKVYLRFKSGNYTTEKGYTINYISVLDDTGVTGLLSPLGKTCGNAIDSISVVVKNFGINTKTNIPITVKIKTPGGVETYNTTLTGPLKTNQSDTIFVHYINTLSPGNYSFSCYTKTVGDLLINANDTVNKTVYIKEIKNSPFFENVDDLKSNMQDWKDLNQKTWINFEKQNSNYFFRAYVGGGEVGGGSLGGRNMDQYLIYDKKIGTITKNAKLYFDYRILTMGQLPYPAILTNKEKIRIIVSSDCGNKFDTIFRIDASNHLKDSTFHKLNISLANYEGQNIIIGFNTSWDGIMTAVDYDNILIVDSAKITGIISDKMDNDIIQIYPNPTTGKFIIQNINSFQNAVDISIYDISGKLIKSGQAKLNDKEITVDLENQKSGIYIIQLKMDEKTLFARVSKE